MKTKLFTLLLAVAASVGTMFAQGTKIGDLYYNLNATNKTAEVAHWDYSGLTTANIPASVTYSGTTYSVTSIGRSAFDLCSSLTSVTIPNSVTSIGEGAFLGCTGLTSVTIPNSVTSIGNSAFFTCSGLISIEIPNSVTSIGEGAFAECRGLTSVTIPNSVTSIGNDAFYGCSSLTKVNITDIAAWCNIAFGHNEANPLYYAKHLFVNDVEVTDLVIPNSVTSIGVSLFQNCSSLTSVTIPNSVTSIGSSAFGGCSSLNSVTLNSNAIVSTSRMNGIFGSQVKKYIIGESVTSIGEWAFSYCDGLTSVPIPNSVSSIGQSAFYGCSSLTSVTIPNSVTSIGNSAFSGCSRLSSVTIPNSVTSIGDGAFYNCSGLTSVTIPNSVTSIGEYAFEYCSGLTSVTIPNSVSSIGEDAFYGCSSLTAYVPCGEMARFKQMMSGWEGQDKVKYAPLSYTITINAEHGNVTYPQTICDDMLLYATPYYGYHFVKWSDGNTDNPRTFVLTQDTTFIAEFARNTVITYIYDSNMGYVSGPTTAASVGAESITFEAIPNYGYHFSQWSDGVTDNPRTIVLTQDTTFTAEFAINNYTIETQSSLPESGIILGGGTYEYLSQQTVTAIPNYGYHFVKWVIDDNTGAISVAQAYAIASALGAGETTTKQYTIYGYVTGTYGSYYNSYYISDSPDVPGNFIAFKCVSSADIGQYVKVTGYLTNYKGNTPETTSGASITPNDFSPRANPCTFTLKNNISFVAEFAKNVYTISLNNAEHGTISGNTSAEYLDEVILTANPERYYHFAQWSDGNKENPRTIVMTQDTAFAAEFAVDKSGVCGDDNLLTWTFEDESKTLAISGKGTLNSNYTFGVEAPTQTERLIIAEGVTSVGNNAFKDMSSSITSLALPSTVTEIGDYAFAGMNNRKFNTLVLPNTIIRIGAHAFDGASYLQTIHFGSTLEEIGDYAFNGCTRVKQMTCLAEITPNVGTDGLTSINSLAELYVPNEYLFDYQIDSNWSRFVLKPYGATETTVTDNDVAVVADDNTATFTWPTNNTADSYTIDITKDGVLFCQLTFNANGQLTGIAFAPGRNGQSMAPAATLTTSGMQFTVTGLNSGTNYAFSLTVKSGSTVVASYTGAFATTGGVPTSTDVLQSALAPRKFIRDNQVLIMRGGKTYTIQGVEVK